MNVQNLCSSDYVTEALIRILVWVFVKYTCLSGIGRLVCYCASLSLHSVVKLL